ncbi:hypothetical protein PAPYR_2818 [Paratrimastix pyriformis]|uniref:Uncharacterized protein n=1 Tax=Paratrimastix pyriformis TaxID=342808 RepID=A0ABQ8UW26_9EUKA|nr:hypothetical protein PAPYR_2818 [Paratrimastix pyriformis]
MNPDTPPSVGICLGTQENPNQADDSQSSEELLLPDSNPPRPASPPQHPIPLSVSLSLGSSQELLQEPLSQACTIPSEVSSTPAPATPSGPPPPPHTPGGPTTTTPLSFLTPTSQTAKAAPTSAPPRIPIPAMRSAPAQSRRVGPGSPNLLRASGPFRLTASPAAAPAIPVSSPPALLYAHPVPATPRSPEIGIGTTQATTQPEAATQSPSPFPSQAAGHPARTPQRPEAAAPSSSGSFLTGRVSTIDSNHNHNIPPDTRSPTVIPSSPVLPAHEGTATAATALFPLTPNHHRRSAPAPAGPEPHPHPVTPNGIPRHLGHQQYHPIPRKAAPHRYPAKHFSNHRVGITPTPECISPVPDRIAAPAPAAITPDPPVIPPGIATTQPPKHSPGALADRGEAAEEDEDEVDFTIHGPIRMAHEAPAAAPRRIITSALTARPSPAARPPVTPLSVMDLLAAEPILGADADLHADAVDITAGDSDDGDDDLVEISETPPSQLGARPADPHHQAAPTRVGGRVPPPYARASRAAPSLVPQSQSQSQSQGPGGGGGGRRHKRQTRLTFQKMGPRGEDDAAAGGGGEASAANAVVRAGRRAKRIDELMHPVTRHADILTGGPSHPPAATAASSGTGAAEAPIELCTLEPEASLEMLPDPTPTAPAPPPPPAGPKAVASVKERYSRLARALETPIRPPGAPAAAAMTGVAADGQTCGHIPYKYEHVVRNKALREQMDAHHCEQCAKFYQALQQQGGQVDADALLQQTSRHRCLYQPRAPQRTTGTSPWAWAMTRPPTRGQADRTRARMTLPLVGASHGPIEPGSS